MKNDYLLPGIASIILAILLPTTVAVEIFNLGNGDWRGVLVGFDNWGFTDVLSLVIGLLCIYAVFNLKKILNEQLNFKSVDVPLLILIGISVVFHILLVVFEGVFGSMNSNSGDTLEYIMTGIAIACLIAFGVIDIVIGIILLTKGDKIPSILKVLAIVSIIQGVFEISVVMFLFVVVTMPIYMIILAVYFLRKPETIEVV